MDAEKDYNLLSEIMHNANIGWWKADIQDADYIYYGPIASLLGLEEGGCISFENFNKRILREEQPHTTVRSFDNIQQTNETVYLLDTVKGPTWVRSKICMQKTDENGKTKIYGIAEIQDAPYMSSATQMLRQREQLLHNIYKHLPVGIEVYNTDGVLTDLNDKELEMFHLQRKEDLLGINIFDNPIFPKEMKEKLKKYEDADFTFRYDFSKVGSYYNPQIRTGTIDLVTKVTTLYDENHTPANYLLINADKTETTVAYNKIQEFESFFELIGNYAKVGYAHYDLLTRQGDAQHSWYINIGEQEGTPLSRIIGVYRHIHPEDRRAMLGFLNNAAKGMEDKFNKEVRVLREDSSYTWTHVNLIVKTYAPERNSIELICINYDITRLKATEAMLIDAKEKAEESDRLKSAFLANMSHEIRTPLNAIVGFSELMVYSEDPAEKEEYMSIIQSNNELLLRLINDILDLSKIESGILDRKRETFNLAKVCNELYTMIQPKITNPDVEFQMDNSSPDCWIFLDRSRLKQVWMNYLTNAVKCTKSGYIKMGYSIEREGIRIYVEDSGVGIPEELQERVFGRFQKLNEFAQGTGLGLAISRAIIEGAGGEVGFTSTPGIGSTFWAWIPCEISTQKEHNPTISLPLQHQLSLNEIDKKELKILIAEDNESNYSLVQHILKSYHLTHVQNGAEAVNKVREEEFDLVLMDMKMPVMGGLEATRKIREFNNRIPIIALTANAFDADRISALDAGCNEFLAKPLKKSQLLELFSKKW